MTVDWNAIATIAAPVIGLFLGVWVNRRFESGPRLISYYGHVSSFRHTPAGGQPIVIHTHSVVLRNTGRRSAKSIRLTHAVLPDFNVWPALMHSIETLPNGSRDIVIPTLVPGEEVTISYLYFPPLTVDRINTGIKHDQGFAQQIRVLLQRQYPRWFNNTAATFMLLGIIAMLYVVYEVAKWSIERLP